MLADTLTYISWSGTQVRFAAASEAASSPPTDDGVGAGAGLSAVLATLAGSRTAAGLGAGASTPGAAADAAVGPAAPQRQTRVGGAGLRQGLLSAMT